MRKQSINVLLALFCLGLTDRNVFGLLKPFSASRFRRLHIPADPKGFVGSVGAQGSRKGDNNQHNASHSSASTLAHSTPSRKEHNLKNGANMSASTSILHEEFNITYLNLAKEPRYAMGSVEKAVRSVPGLGLGQSQRSLSESLVISDRKNNGDKFSRGMASVSVSVKSNDPVVSQIQETRANIEALKRKVETMEKMLSSNTGPGASSTLQEKKIKAANELDDFMDSLKMKQLELSKENIQKCAIFSFFLIGCAVISSVYHRLWLLGGIIGAWWSSDAVQRDSRGGSMTRRVGVQLAQFIRDLQERWNYMVIYYETGRLAYASRKRWEKFDKKFNIDERFAAFKKLAMKRATQLNSEEGLRATLSDLWNSTKEVREQASKLDNEYGLSRNIGDFTRGLYLITNQSVGSWLDEVLRVGSRGKSTTKRASHSYSSTMVNPWFPTWLLGPQSQYNPGYWQQSKYRKGFSREKELKRDRERLQEILHLKRERRERELDRQRYRQLEKELRYSGFTPPGSGGFVKGIKEFFGQASA